MRVAGLHRFFAALLVLAYLLVGSGLARAVVWCVDESGHSHVEFNSAGDCQVVCDSVEAQQAGPALPGLNSNATPENCQDVSLLTSHAQDSRLLKLGSPQDSRLLKLGSPQVAALSMPLPSARTLAGTLLHTSTPRFAQIPPTTALAALRTIILLT